MKCKQVQLLLTDYIQHNLDEKTAAQIKHHLDSCETCARSYAYLKKVYSFIEIERAQKTSPFLKMRILASLRNSVENISILDILFARFKLIFAGIIIAFALIYALLISNFLYNSFEKKYVRNIDNQLFVNSDEDMEYWTYYIQ